MEENCETKRQEDFGKMQYGCEHYRRRCKIRAPCCNKIFPCRHCHNEATSSLSDPKDRHELIRHEVKQVVCSVCDVEQQIARVCSNCGVTMGEYFCEVCKFYEDDTKKKQFHCDECGICRVGGRENFFHCQKCGSCYSVDLHDNHLCVENSMKSYCPICYEYLFDSVKGTRILKCGHTMHMDCYLEMEKQNQYRCPICSKSVINMSRPWEILDREMKSGDLCTEQDFFHGRFPCLAWNYLSTIMPEQYQYEVKILCNDCNNTSEVFFHIFGHKCRHCNSYNTRRIEMPDHHQRH